MKVYIEKWKEYDSIKYRDFIDFTNFEVGIRPILSEPMCSLLSVTSHCSVLRRRRAGRFGT